MHTITPNSEANKSRFFEKHWLLLLLVCAPLLSGCVSAPKAADFFLLSPDSTKHRALQTRMFETTDEKELLSASAAVLQDLGFQVEECATDVGMLRAAKERGAREYGQEIMQVFIFLVGSISGKAFIVPVDLHQQISAILVTHRSETDSSRFTVRINFYRKLWKSDGHSGDQSIPPGQFRLEMIYDQNIYQQFFAKLSKSVFLEAQEI